MKFKATKEELDRGIIVTPGWHIVEMLGAKEDSDSSGAGLLVITGRVVGGKPEDQGAVLRAQFSEKAQAMVKNFWESLTGTKFEPEKEIDIRDQHVRGKRMEWFVNRGKYRGRDTNEVVDYRPVQSA